MRQLATANNGHRCFNDCDYITRSAIFGSTANSNDRRRKNIRIREKIGLHDKTLRIQKFSDLKFPL